MLIPITVKASEVFEGDDLKRLVQCICGQQIILGDCSVCWTYPTGKPTQLGWFPVCAPSCIVAHIAEGGA